jgi:hypothetical protein
MAKPPPDVDPEKFIIGRGIYHNLDIARVHFDDETFRIEPAPMPVGWIVFLNLVFIGFFGTAYWLASRAAGGIQTLEKVSIIGIGLLVGGGFTAGMVYTYRHANRRGPWLIYDKRTRCVTLPRENLSFAREEIVQLQYITTKDLSWDDDVGNEQRSELNVITVQGGERKRWPLLQSIFTDKAFDHVVKPLVEQTDLPVVRVRDKWLGWRVTERPFNSPLPSPRRTGERE